MPELEISNDDTADGEPRVERTRAGSVDTDSGEPVRSSRENPSPQFAAKTVRTPEQAQELARRSAEARAAKREARERRAELDRLTLRGRVAVVVAGELAADEIALVLQAQLRRAKQGHKDSAGELRQWITLAADLDQTDDQPTDSLADLREMSPAQRAAVRAQLLKQAQEAVADAQAAEAEHITT